MKLAEERARPDLDVEPDDEPNCAPASQHECADQNPALHHAHGRSIGQRLGIRRRHHADEPVGNR